MENTIQVLMSAFHIHGADSTFGAVMPRAPDRCITRISELAVGEQGS